MTKKETTPNQPSLLKRSVPQMPEGYYSSGPNPNLAKFVAEHSTPYDPATDDYDVPPFDKPITTTKATAIYNMHTYWSKKPHDAIQQYIRHYTQPGDLVLDPFCGSGGTALAALMEGRKAIAIDLSPAATFITKNYCTPVDVDELQQAFEELKAKVKPEMDWLYETRCDRCGGKATTAYTVYSQVFQCPRCLEKVALFDCPEAKAYAKNGKEKTIRVCPHCQEQGVEEEINTSRKKFGSIPVMVSYICEEGCKPVRGERRHNDPNKKKKEYFEKFDLSKLGEIGKGEIPYWYPSPRMMNNPEGNDRWGELWRSGIHEDVDTVDDFFSKRNLWALALIKYYILQSSTKLNDVLLFLFSSNIQKASKMMGHNSDGIGRILKGTYYVPPIEHDINVDRFMSDTLSDFKNGYSSIELKSTDLQISTSDARRVFLPTSSIDYIFTDPPYAGNVQYGELNFLWEVWLGLATTWIKDEIIVNDTRGMTDEKWSNMLYKALEECYRVLKPGRWISLCYHDTSEGTWQLVQDIMAELGFISEKTNSTNFIETATKTMNQHFGEKVTKRDLVINFRKPRPGELGQLTLISGEEDPHTFNEKARAILAESLERRPGQTADTLYDELVSRMVRKGEFERHNFSELLKSVAEESSSRWYLRETAATLDEAEARKEAAAAQRLETFMQSYLKTHSAEPGVHYSDLFEQYLPVSDKPRRLLQDWLIEYFYKTEEGTLRPPRDDAERQQKTSLRTSGALRTIKRFVNALNEGVPPYDRDKPANPATLAEWIYQCRRAGLYEMGKTLYEKGGLRFDALSDELQLQVEEDYQICTRRGAEKQAERRTTRRSQPNQQELPL